MLWIIDNAGLPCKNAKFVRVAHRSIHFLLDHSTFSQHEVASLRHTATDAVFPKALYVVLDGYLRSEIGSTPPSVQLNFDTSEGIAVPNSDARLVLNGGPQFEHALEDVPQRITYAFDVVFSNENPFSAINPMTRVRSLIAVGAFDNHVTEGTLQLSLNPNPYMTDGPVEWLSTDIRVFTIKQGESFSGLAGLVHNGNAVPFIQTLLNRFNGGEGGVFDTIQENNSLDLSPLAFSFFPLRIANIFNYAVAKVRYRSLTEAALGVQVFFRLFQAATADVSFHGNTGYYRRSGNGANAIPLLGKSATNQLLTMPFFADERVADMRMQPNGNNKKPLAFDASGGEVDVYFGCWLDINQGTPRFPRVVNSDGPFNPSEMVSIQQLVRGLHQCLVAEIHYDLDPIPIGATPGTSDNLAQRNLTIDHSDNPGSPDTHIVRHTFELKPTKGDKGTTFGAPDADGYVSQGEFGRYYQRYAHPDELMINWGNLPRTSAVSIYLPEILADDILAMQPFTRLSTSRLEKVDEHTIRCEGAADITYIPIPMTGRTENITGIFTVELPSTVIKGQTFHTVVQQIEGTSRRIIGAFQMTIPVSTADVLLPMLSHKLSILKHIQRAVPPSDRWYSTFNRYVLHFSDKVKALGGNPDTILPSATGLATTFTEGVTSRQCLILQWLMTALLVLTMVVMALVPTILGSISMVILIVALIATAVFWWKRCKPSTCTAFRAILLALNIAVAIVCLTAALTGISTTAVLTAIGILSIFNIISLLILMWKKCL